MHKTFVLKLYKKYHRILSDDFTKAVAVFCFAAAERHYEFSK
jgi:hypothetical protein